MNFQSIKQLNFDLLRGGDKGRRRGKKAIAIRESRIDLSKELFTALGSPKRVDIGTNGGAFIGIRSNGATELPVSNSNGSGGTIYGKEYSAQIIRQIKALSNIDLSEYYIVIDNPMESGDYIVFDSDSATVIRRQTKQIKE